MSQSLVEQIKQGKLWDFHGGVHPAENKKQSTKTPILNAFIPQTIVLPLKQHIGTHANLCVKVGEYVQKGQALTQANLAFMVPIHAPTSGTITAIEPRTTAHPSGLSDLCVVIKPDNEDQWGEKTKLLNYQDYDAEKLIEHIRQSGIAGLGGAGFPTARKLQTGVGTTEFLIINAAECEPYITADDRLMQDYASEIMAGIHVLQHILKPKLTIIGIEDNKRHAVKALYQAAKDDESILIRVIPTKYPSGGSKQLIQILTGKEVPHKAHSASVGIIMQNVGTAFAIKRAVIDGEPLIERVITVTGDSIKKPGNTFALLGTPVAELLERHGYKADKKYPRLIMGGSLMGFTLPHANVPVTKITNCILAPKRRELPIADHALPCIRCSECAQVCPVSLLPQQLHWYSTAQDYDKCEDYNLFDCIECGACAYVCPSDIPLVQQYRQAKAEIKQRQKDSENAERARIRFEEKQARLERDKIAREQKFAKAAEKRREQMQSTQGDDAIAAAIERVKSKQSAQSQETKPAVAAAIARAKAKQAQAAKEGHATPDNSEMMKLREERKAKARALKAKQATQQAAETDLQSAPAENETATPADDKKAAVTAAIARAKAKKAAEADSQDAPSENKTATPADDKKAAVAAAIARAKAKKAAEADSQDTPAENKTATPADDKKAAVAAAIARAKARKAAEANSQDAPAENEAPTPADDKKAAVAAAIARAKARKAAEADSQDTPAENKTATPTDDKKAAVAAAIARAKARKASQQAANKEN